MKIQPLHPNFQSPTYGSEKAGALDLYMPARGSANTGKLIGLGFAAAVPEGHVALLLPRSGTGTKHGVELANTCGVIDSDYRGEWKAAIRTKHGRPFAWNVGDRVLQAVIVPVVQVELEIVGSLDETDRGSGGFGHTGN